MPRDPRTGRFPARPEAQAGGEGWGGDAKGGGPAGMARIDPRARTSAAIARKALRAAEMEDVIYEIAKQGEHEANRLNAAYRLKTLLDGLPVATQVQVDGGAVGDWTDEELRAAADDLRNRIAGQDRSGTGETEGGKPVN